MNTYASLAELILERMSGPLGTYNTRKNAGSQNLHRKIYNVVNSTG